MPWPSSTMQLPFEHLKPTPALAQSLSMLPIGMRASGPTTGKPAHARSAPSLFAAPSFPSASIRPSTALDSTALDSVGGLRAEPLPPRPSSVAESSTTASASVPRLRGFLPDAEAEHSSAGAGAAGSATPAVEWAWSMGAERAARRLRPLNGEVRHRLEQSADVLLAALRAVPHFTRLAEEELRTLLESCEIVAHPRYAVVVREGVPSEANCAFYVILAGQIRVIQGQFDGVDTQVLLGAGDCFGEAALVSHFPRMATIIAVTDAKVLRLKSAALLALPWFQQAVEPCARSITCLVLHRLLRTLRTFERLSDETLQRAAALFEYVEWPPHHVVSAEGDRSSVVCVITHGEVRIFARGSRGDEVNLGCVRSSDLKPWVGERSALSSKPRMATIVCTGPVQVGASAYA